MKPNLPANLDTAISQFAAAYAKLLESFIEQSREVGQLLIALIEAHPKFKEELHAAHPEIPLAALNTLERVGRGAILPEVAYGTPSAGRAALAKLPVSDQERLLKEGVSVLLLRNGDLQTLRVEIDNLTPDQVRQVFDRDIIRSEGAQRAWLEDKLTKATPVAIEQDYVIKGKFVKFRNGPKVSRATLAQILAQFPD